MQHILLTLSLTLTWATQVPRVVEVACVISHRFYAVV